MGEDRKVAIVTGAGQGIGAAIAESLAAKGYVVVIASYDMAGGERTAREISRNGGIAVAYHTDVAIEASVQSMVGRAADSFHQVDVLVNNAAVYPKSPVVDLSKAEWDRVLAVNLKGAYLCCKYVLPEMLSRAYGRIVNIASGRALEGGAGFAHYSAAKAGLLALTKSLALEVARSGILVNAVAPGITDTAMPRLHSTDEQLYSRAETIPMGRLGRPEDVAETVAYLVSDHNTFITGQTVCVNGGAIML